MVSSPKPVGYTAITARYDLEVIPNRHASFISHTSTHRTNLIGDEIEEIYPARYWPGDSLGAHLEFALKYDGTNLAILAELFNKAPEPEILECVLSKPTGKYTRRIWFLYEFLTEKKLPIDDLQHGNYIPLLEPDEYYTFGSRKIFRQRIINNLPGNGNFCPLIRRTEVLRQFEASDLTESCRKKLASYPPEILQRALGYLYTKETKSSFGIEHVTPNASRTERFVALLKLAEEKDFCEKEFLLDLQNRIVDPRFKDSGYRTNQNYIGETIAWQGEHIHYVCPKPEDLPGLMEGWLAAHRQMEEHDMPAVLHAAVIAYGFVFLHPFEDGNGRIHRFLIHNILARRHFSPEGIMFPISAAMLKHIKDYDNSLETFSRRLMPLVEYSLDEMGTMTVSNETKNWYRFMDMTPQAEALYQFVDRTIETELLNELEFLARYDKTKRNIQEIVDMPDRKIDLFIRCCLQNNGRLSARKRTNFFQFLTEEEIAGMEQAVQDSYDKSYGGDT